MNPNNTEDRPVSDWRPRTSSLFQKLCWVFGLESSLMRTGEIKWRWGLCLCPGTSYPLLSGALKICRAKPKPPDLMKWSLFVRNNGSPPSHWPPSAAARGDASTFLPTGKLLKQSAEVGERGEAEGDVSVKVSHWNESDCTLAGVWKFQSEPQQDTSTSFNASQ